MSKLMSIFHFKSISLLLLLFCYLPISAQDFCADAIDIGLLSCGSGPYNEGPLPSATYTPDSEAIDCLIGVNAGWYSYTVDPSVSQLQMFGVKELFEGSCGNLNPVHNSCFSIHNEQPPLYNTTYYVLLEDVHSTRSVVHSDNL